jgi:hypothetical protein
LSEKVKMNRILLDLVSQAEPDDGGQLPIISHVADDWSF